ncbi:MAG: aspartyl/asparaginyl beta-hydroxylase domain-containing protein [Alteromonadaceae bacterium]|nr:aspartyl/asparaginyl beta-hydroxylase domain-containing protein [Alteromonadaceae bacterium]
MQRSFYPIADFPKLAELGKHWQTIQNEFYALNAPVIPINRVNKDFTAVYNEIKTHMQNDGEYGWLLGWGGKTGENPDWLQYGLIANYNPIPWASTSMPKTLELLKNIPGIKVCGLATMKPNCYLATHTHPEISIEQLLQFHITLDTLQTSNYNYLNVNGEFNQNETGESVIFDGSLEHFAINASTANRTILYIEFKKDELLAC